VRHLGIVGECNIQFAFNANTNDYRIIEINARLSRSSALASKATGYPLAFVAAKIALGYTLDQIGEMGTPNSAYVAPSLDYMICKIPRWDLTKFSGVSRLIGSSMKSVGEIMSIGRSFEEMIQKGLRMIGQGMHGFVENKEFQIEHLAEKLTHATDNRIFVISEAMQWGYTVEQIHQSTKIDRWFLQKLKHIIDIDLQLKGNAALAMLTTEMEPSEFMEMIENSELLELFYKAKVYGFSDFQIARALGLESLMKMEDAQLLIRKWRKELDIMPAVNQIDTLAAEYPAQTNYLYLTYL
jgi:carbamoyl-phosphate synthase large subunit